MRFVGFLVFGKMATQVADGAGSLVVLVKIGIADFCQFDNGIARLIVENATGSGRVMMASLLCYAKRRLVDFSGIKTINQVQINNKYGDS